MPESGFFLPGTRGAGIHPLVAPIKGETIIMKHFSNSFREEENHGEAQQQKQLLRILGEPQASPIVEYFPDQFRKILHVDGFHGKSLYTGILDTIGTDSRTVPRAENNRNILSCGQ